jgi:signal transduction histidine kinase/ActR/RegA family two-component response regulator
MKKHLSFYNSSLSLNEQVLKQALLAVTFISYYCCVLYGSLLSTSSAAFINALISSIVFSSLLLISPSNDKIAFRIETFFRFCALIALSLNWIFTNGLHGGSGYFFLVLIGFYAIASSDRDYILFICITLIDVFLLLLLEYNYPQYIHFDLSNTGMFWASSLNLLICFIISSLALILVKIEYDKEHQNVIEKQNRLIAANNARSRFLANISHEIRTPLNGVMGMASLLESSKPNSEQKEYVQTIKISSKRLLKIINEILDYSKAEAGKTELRIESFSLIECIEDAINITSPKALEKGLTLTYFIEKNIPNILSGDGGKIQQVLVNLIGNATKFTEEGSIHLNIQRISKIDQQVSLKFSIQDTGIGIPKESLINLFEAFTQVDDSRTRLQSGTGLGLAISKHFVDLMGGSMGVNSEEKQGSIFHFSIELGVLKNQSILPLPVDPTIIDNQIANKTSLDILLVEDDKINRLLAVRILEKMGYKPDTATNGQEAIDMLQNQDYNLVLMDIQMPILDGLEATQIIRKEFSYQPTIIAMTANAMLEDKRLCEAAGMDDFLSKPIDVRTLEDMLLKWRKNI